MAKYDTKSDPPTADMPDDESTGEQVKRIFKEHPGAISRLEELGFVYQDDDLDEEEQEEAVAGPENPDQEVLVSFFNGDIPLSDQTVEIFLRDTRGPHPNYPLFRKYFKTGNKHLLSMIVHGLQQFPASDELLSDLAFFHEHHAILSILVKHYMAACVKQSNLLIFSDLVMDFHYAVAPDGYDALYALREKFPVGTDKRKIIDFLAESVNDGIGEDDEAF